MKTFDKVWRLGALRIWIGNEDAPTGDRIAFHITIHFRYCCLFSNYKGG